MDRENFEGKNLGSLYPEMFDSRSQSRKVAFGLDCSGKEHDWRYQGLTTILLACVVSTTFTLIWSEVQKDRPRLFQISVTGSLVILCNLE